MAKFGKRHYEAIALAVQETEKLNFVYAEDFRNELVRVLGETFRNDNPEFKRDRFFRACVPGANVKARS